MKPTKAHNPVFPVNKIGIVVVICANEDKCMQNTKYVVAAV
jgi:hypothetical protein